MGSSIWEGLSVIRNDPADLTKFVTTVWTRDLPKDIKRATHKAPDQSIDVSTPRGKWQGIKAMLLIKE